jgi:hypothetical protein
MPRFVILEHDHPVLHWDLMLEAGEVLRTWRLGQLPEQPGCYIEAMALGDHRKMYLDYEGPVSGGRGKVTRWDTGSFTEEADSGPGLRLVLAGARIRGRVRLEPVEGTTWRFELLRDSHE